MSFTTALVQYRDQDRHWDKLMGRRSIMKNKTITDWTVEQLNIQPYQHILEVGFGAGHTLQEVATKLKIGFLAGIDDSMRMYRRAFRKNKKMISRQLLQLHIGGIEELSYPHHYFHTIYGVNIQVGMKDPVSIYVQMQAMLRSGGKLVMVIQPAWAQSEEEIFEAADEMRRQFMEAGLERVEVEFRDMHPVTGISVKGFKE
jgi:tRNA A58 N-methylase Trm61